MDCNQVLEKIKSLGNPEAVAGMARYGINPKNTYGVSMPNLRSMRKAIGTNHKLAEELWSSGVHEARILAGIVDDPKATTEEQMERWIRDFDSWDVCDQCCKNLFARTRFVEKKVEEWTRRTEEFVKRAGFVLMAEMAVHHKDAQNSVFMSSLHIIRREATDERNYVKKADDWAMRQIGKRNLHLNEKTIAMARAIGKIDSKSARWMASNALKELQSEKIMRKLHHKVSN
jgi:3-methyladenine DNA glycosylase AlkD